MFEKGRVIVAEHYRQMSYHDECGYKATLIRSTKDGVTCEDAYYRAQDERLLKDVVEALGKSIDGRENGSNPSIGIVWSKKANICVDSKNPDVVCVYTCHPIGD